MIDPKVVLRELSAMLLQEWDPIGVRGEPEARSEYEHYAGGVYRLVSSGATPEVIARHLAALERDRMGYDTDPRLLLPVAERIRARYQALDSSSPVETEVVRATADYFVLDALADDIESLEQILPSVRDSAQFSDTSDTPIHFSRDDVISVLRMLIVEGHICALVFDEDKKRLVDAGEYVVPKDPIDELWFRLTPLGRRVLERWVTPPKRRP